MNVHWTCHLISTVVSGKGHSGLSLNITSYGCRNAYVPMLIIWVKKPSVYEYLSQIAYTSS